MIICQITRFFSVASHLFRSSIPVIAIKSRKEAAIIYTCSLIYKATYFQKSQLLLVWSMIICQITRFFNFHQCSRSLAFAALSPLLLLRAEKQQQLFKTNLICKATYFQRTKFLVNVGFQAHNINK